MSFLLFTEKFLGGWLRLAESHYELIVLILRRSVVRLALKGPQLTFLLPCVRLDYGARQIAV
jgi:hypothetical protein